MPLTGKDVQEAVFTTSRKGYSKDEVDDFLDRVVESLEEYRGRLSQLEAQLGISSAPGQPGDQGAGFAAPAAAGASVAAAPAAGAGSAEPAGTKPASPLTTTSSTPSPTASTTPAPAGAAPAGPASAGAASETAAPEPGAGHQAGWYPDPWQQASERYYDGKEWTAQTR